MYDIIGILHVINFIYKFFTNMQSVLIDLHLNGAWQDLSGHPSKTCTIFTQQTSSLLENV